MLNALKKTGRFLAKAALSLVALSILLLFALQILLVAGINFFNAGKAHDFIQSQLTAATQASGYDITFGQLFYDPVRGFTVYDVAVADRDGRFMTLDRFSLSVAFSKIPLRQLDLFADAGTLTLLRLPAAREKAQDAPSAPLEPFAVPDIYFRSLQISGFSLQTLFLGEDIAGMPLSFSPNLKAGIALTDVIAADATLSPGAKQAIGGVSLPETLRFEGVLTPATLDFALEELRIASKDYTIHSYGTAKLSSGGTVDMTLTADYPDLKTLTRDALDSATITVKIEGPHQRPALSLNGRLATASLKERGLSDIILSAAAEDIVSALKGTVSVKTSYREQPVTLSSVVSYNAPSLTLENLTASAPHISASGQGVFRTDISVFDGGLALTASDLSHYKDLVQADIAGAVDADLRLSGKDGVQSASLDASVEGLRYDDIKLQKADVAAFFGNVANPFPQTADIKILNLSLSPTLSVARLSAVLKETDGAAYALSLDGKATLPSPVSFKGKADISGLDTPVPTAENIALTVGMNGSSISLSGLFDTKKLDLKASTTNFRAGDLPASLPDGLSDLRLSGNVLMTGTPAAPVTIADIKAGGIDAGKYKGLSVSASLGHKDGRASFSLTGTGTGIRALKADLSAPLTFALLPFAFDLEQTAALSGMLLADLDLGALSPLFLPPSSMLAGSLKADGKIAGTVGAPDITGTVSLRNGNFSDEANGILFADIAGDGTFTKDSFTLRSLSATDGDAGRLNGRGRISFGKASATDLSVKMSDFRVPRSELANGMIDASLSLEDSAGGFSAKGNIDIAEMNIIVPETFQSRIPELNIVERKNDAASSPAKAILLAIRINAPNEIFVRGWGLDAEFGGNIDITGDAGAPQFNGSLASRRGRYEEFGKRFTLARADLRFQGEIPPSPYLDIEATTPAEDVTASILLTGPVKSPQIAFSSTPALPQDEVLSRVLFGTDTAKITPFQAIQLTQTLQRFSGKGGSGIDPLGLLRSTTGLDDISIDTDESGETNVGVGKYLTDKVYLEVEKGKAANSGNANIQIEVTPNVNIESEIGQDAQTGGGIFWKRDY